MPDIPTNITCRVDGIGVWGPGFSSWPELRDFFNGDGSLDTDQVAGPKPEVIPANERRRAPLPVRLAVETSWQASQKATIDPKQLACIFSSTFGDIDITNYMCNTLNTEAKLLSPTKFHNSVHNAPAGYWTISTGCMQSANSVAGFQESVSVTLFEAMTQASSQNQQVLLTFCDAPAKGPLIPILKNTYPFSASLVLTPVAEPQQTGTVETTLTLGLQTQPADWPAISVDEFDLLYRDNPSARILGLLEALAKDEAATIILPLSKGTSLSLEIRT